jgi:hypothetical protein
MQLFNMKEYLNSCIYQGRKILRPYTESFFRLFDRSTVRLFDKKIPIVLFSLFSFHFSLAQPMTPETLWEFGRVSDVQVSPDGKTLLFGVTTYDVTANRGYARPLRDACGRRGGREHHNTPPPANLSARWRPDGQKIGFISSRGGSAQLWEMNPDGGNPLQISTIEGGITALAMPRICSTSTSPNR